MRLPKHRIHFLEVGVATGAVNDGAETRIQIHGLSGEIELEVRCRRRALHVDVFEHAFERAGGVQRPADAFDRVQSSIRELVVAR